MNELIPTTEQEIRGWCSTYGLVTAQRLLELYKIKLDPDDLLQALKNPKSFYHNLLKIPMRNVFNGIIWQQARDYQIYAQKLFVDYMLSGEPNKDADSPGGTIREDLEIQRQNLMSMNDSFHVLELDGERLIAKCQATLIHDADKWSESLQKIIKPIKKLLTARGLDFSEDLVKRALVSLLARYDFKTEFQNSKESWEKVQTILGAPLDAEAKKIFINEIATLSEIATSTQANLNAHMGEVDQMGVLLRQFRSDFYRFILKSKEFLQSLPDYKMNQIDDVDNRESLFFDASLGEDLPT